MVVAYHVPYPEEAYRPCLVEAEEGSYPLLLLQQDLLPTQREPLDVASAVALILFQRLAPYQDLLESSFQSYSEVVGLQRPN
jgi:hypothetical protein